MTSELYDGTLMKRILFVMTKMPIGGSTRSLLNLISVLPQDKFYIDLFIMKHTGELMKEIPRTVNVLPEVAQYSFLIDVLFSNLRIALQKKDIPILLVKIVEKVIDKLVYFLILLHNALKISSNIENTKNQLSWRTVRYFLPKINGQYDIAVGYEAPLTTYLVIDKVTAAKKMSWFHGDYSRISNNFNSDEKYFRKLNNLITVSDSSRQIITHYFPKIHNRVITIENIILEKAVAQLSNAFVPSEQDSIFDFDGVRILTVARLENVKRIDRAVWAAWKLKQDGHAFRWYVIGDGPEREALLTKAADYKVEDCLFFLGEKSNPYPYYKFSDLFVLTSENEGNPVVIVEARMFSLFVVMTNFNTSGDCGIVDDKNGFIVDNNREGVYRGIKNYLLSAHIKKKMIFNATMREQEIRDRVVNIFSE